MVRLDDNRRDVPRPYWGTCARARLLHQSPRGRSGGEVEYEGVSLNGELLSGPEQPDRSYISLSEGDNSCHV